MYMTGTKYCSVNCGQRYRRKDRKFQQWQEIQRNQESTVTKNEAALT
jgi:hypothetical protein